jgi:hypothetical protein
VPADPRKPRDLALLDAIDAFDRESFTQTVWRVAREGRDPLPGTPSRSRCCDGTFPVLYASLERDGTIAEVHALLTNQPVFPFGIRWFVHRLSMQLSKALRLADLAALGNLGVDTTRYRKRDDRRTQEIADAAQFLGFDGLLAPSTRWDCMSLVMFTEHVGPEDLRLEAAETKPIDWRSWRTTRRM